MPPPEDPAKSSPESSLDTSLIPHVPLFAGSNYYVRILSTIDRELLKPNASVALHKHSNALVDVLPPEADSSIMMLTAGRCFSVWVEEPTFVLGLQVGSSSGLPLLGREEMLDQV